MGKCHILVEVCCDFFFFPPGEKNPPRINEEFVKWERFSKPCYCSWCCKKCMLGSLTIDLLSLCKSSNGTCWRWTWRGFHWIVSSHLNGTCWRRDVYECGGMSVRTSVNGKMWIRFYFKRSLNYPPCRYDWFSFHDHQKSLNNLLRL